VLAALLPAIEASAATVYALLWSSAASMAGPRVELGVAMATNGKIYAIGGRQNGAGTALNTVEEYDPATNSWRSRAGMPTARAGLAVVGAMNGKVYAIGGYSVTTTVEAYDPATNIWEPRSPVPTPRDSFSAVAASNGKIYVIGGCCGFAGPGGDSRSMKVEEYDPATDTWTSRADMPTGRRFPALVGTPDGKVYAIGGAEGGPSMSTAVEEYDTATNTWSTKSPMPTGRSSLAAVLASNGRIYAMGGLLSFQPGDCCFGSAATVEEYDPATNTWTTKTPLPTPRATLGAAATPDGKIYAVGGYNASRVALNTTPLATVDVATIVVDTAAPLLTSLTVNGGALATTSTAVTLALTASDDVSGVKEMSFSNDGATWSAWEAYGPSKAWTLAGGDGPKTVHARVRDFADNVSAVQTVAIALDTALGADWGMTIEDAAIWTNSLDVTLHIAARPGTARMQVSNDGAFVGAQWEPFNAHKAWTMLEPPRPDLITEVVFVRFGDANNNVITGSLVSDSIFLDSVPPTGSLTISSATSIQAPVRQLSLTASDDLSGLNGMRISNRADFAGAAWQTYATSVSWDFTGGGTVYGQFRDKAGNLSPVYSQSLAGALPPGSSPSPSCSPRPPVQVDIQRSNGALVATLSTTGANNGLRAVRFDTFSTAIVDVGSQVNQTSPFAVSIPAGQEPTTLQFTVRRQPGAQSATVRLAAIDGCGEWSTFVGGGPRAF
jgi:N-acetylneuraminic acid mutarotase